MEEINEKELTDFRNEIKDKMCEYPNCNEKAEGIIRTHFVCNKHFKKLREDNKIKISSKEIDSELKIN